MSKKGFTLIELLVVIGIIGILAAGILAAIDPLEQLKKGRDSQKRSVSLEVFNALTRYYAIKGEFPWGDVLPHGPNTLEVDETAVIDELVSFGELKSDFMEGLPAGAKTDITIYTGDNITLYICFDPESKAISGDPSTIYSNNQGTKDTTNCPDPTGGTTCYWCAR